MSFYIIDSLPKTRIGKIVRRVLKARALGVADKSKLLHSKRRKVQT